MLIVTQLINKFSAFYQLEDSRPYLPYSATGLCPSSGKSRPTRFTIFKIHINIHAPYRWLCLPSGLFPSGSLQLKFCNIFLLSVRSVCRAHLVVCLPVRDKYTCTNRAITELQCRAYIAVYSFLISLKSKAKYYWETFVSFLCIEC
jgi:hypothetical protein